VVDPVWAQWVILKKNYEASYEILVAAGIFGLVAICGQHPPLSFDTSFIALHPFIVE
jgi:hypothetical protein